MLEWLTGNWVSLVALLISCASFYVSWRVHRLNRSDLRITDLRFEVKEGKYPVFFVALVNKGRRPVIPKSVHLILKTGERVGSYFFTKQQLDEGTDVEIPFGLIELWNNPQRGDGARIENPLDVVAAEVLDTVGKTYNRRLPRKTRALIEEIWTAKLASFVKKEGQQWTRGIHF